MSNLTSLEKILEMGGGYVLDFSNKTFREFIFENTEIDIYHEKYSIKGSSKANRLRMFFKLETNQKVGKLLLILLDYWKTKKDLDGQFVTLSDNSLFEECTKIAKRLISTQPDITSPSIVKEIVWENEKQRQLNLLLQMFDDLFNSADHQRRGFLLQDLLTRLFQINEISVTKSFQRNDGGEQIDGAFSLNGWFYLVECKWTKKLSDIKELDSLSGKINRSGKQTMGLFLSIEGWSENVPKLLKQNSEKCLILMEGYDLRSVLCGAISLTYLIEKKLEKLNIDCEPYFSAKDLLNQK